MDIRKFPRASASIVRFLTSNRAPAETTAQASAASQPTSNVHGGALNKLSWMIVHRQQRVEALAIGHRADQDDASHQHIMPLGNLVSYGSSSALATPFGACPL